ncbi:cysteine-rich and transmembrane domain-containing protein WIH1-like [Juglans microcarpa x Juglans regia]|uniref:cysteine-rich and transmembrane domain-containing protein WIH1-like n=1 Tax=Juglans microcarpa x Juglans regia TaxID=2249226 RepID=UPI001B7EFE92|nr:cysteine-rich and transmembrane domain-containing protein WIH1-like [Juglans microcarpa x Juglans regia]
MNYYDQQQPDFVGVPQQPHVGVPQQPPVGVPPPQWNPNYVAYPPPPVYLPPPVYPPPPVSIQMNNNSTPQVEYVYVTQKQETGLLESCMALLCCCCIFSIFPCYYC